MPMSCCMCELEETAQSLRADTNEVAAREHQCSIVTGTSVLLNMVFLSMGGMLGTSAGARTRTWAEVNVRPRPLENRNHTLKRCHYVSDPHQHVPYQCRRHQSVAIVCFAETSVFLNIAHPQLCSPHGTRLQCVCAVFCRDTRTRHHVRGSGHRLLPLSSAGAVVCTHLSVSVRVLSVLCLCCQFSFCAVCL